MDDKESSNLSRRSMLKRLGAGAAVVWTAPVLTSLGTRAMAQGTPPPDECADNPRDQCQCVAPSCDGDPDCFCTTPAEGGCVCVDCGNSACDLFEPCNSSADCPSTHVCAVSTCCEPPHTCIPRCGAAPCPTGPGGARAANRT